MKRETGAASVRSPRCDFPAPGSHVGCPSSVRPSAPGKSLSVERRDSGTALCATELHGDEARALPPLHLH